MNAALPRGRGDLRSVRGSFFVWHFQNDIAMTEIQDDFDAFEPHALRCING